MRLIRQISCVIGVLALAACASEQSGAPRTANSVIPAASNVQPGAKTVDSVSAAALFQRVCIDTGARHKLMLEEIAKLPFVQDQRSEILYHQTLNLSFKERVVDGKQACSFVAKVDNPKTATVMLIAAGKGMQTTANPTGGYVNAVAAPY